MRHPQVRRARGGLWNMERDRPRREAANSARALMMDYDLDWLALAESADYLHQLRSLAGCRLVAWDGGAKGETAILVRDGRKIARQRIKRMTVSGWITVRGGHTPPKYLPSVEVNGLDVAAGHTAPSVDWRHGKAFGPVRRVRSILGWTGNARRWLKGHRGPAALLADFNEPPHSTGHGSPHWVARTTGSTIAAPTEPTHGREVIDYAILRGCTGTAERVETKGSDHHAVIFEITY